MSSEHERFKKMVEDSQDVFWEFDENANFTYLSRKIKDLLGFEPEELIGLNAFNLMSADEAERVRRYFDPISKRHLPFKHLENINIHKDGHEVIIESSGTPIFDEEGLFRGYRGIDRDISARKQVETFLRESEERFRTIAEMLPGAVFELDLQGNLRFASRRAFELFGYSAEDFNQGLNAFEMVVPKERALARDRMHQRISGEEVGGVEYTALRKDGSTFPVILNMIPLIKGHEPVGFLGIMTDITERKLAEDSLRKSQELLIETQRIANMGSWIFDAETNQATWSEEAYRIFGVTPQTFIPSYINFLNIVHPDDRAFVEETYSKSLDEGRETSEFEHRIIRMNTGEVGYVHLKCRHEYHPDGTRSRTVGMLQDITDRKKNELALQLASKSAEFANRAKSIFLAKVSHEIRTPLTAIVGFGELMEDAELTTEHRKYLDAINSAGSTLSLLINDILDLSKVESGELVIKQEVFSLQEHIKKLIDIQKQQNTNKNLSFDVSIDSDVPESLVGDQYRIQQIMLNLLGNAIKFTEKGSVDLAVSLAEKSGYGILLDIAVKDTGIGIPTGLQEQIFEPFFQGFDSRSHHCGGSGLGLTISQSLAGLMGGTIRVESQEGVGSTFHLIIPIQIKIDNRSENHLPEKERLHWSGPALKVLLAEDNPINIQLVKAVLENMGHVVTVAENGMVALDTLQANTFDLMLMDIQMPVMDGIDALSVLRDQEQISGKHLMVIALTAYALIGDKEKYLKMGFDGYLSKPFTTKALVDELVRVMPRENFAFITK